MNQIITNKELTNFPEYIFPARNNPELYNYCVQEGQQICNNASIFFCGIARDIGPYLERNILRIHRTGDMFKNYGVFIYENNSTDDTVDILQRYKSDIFNFYSETTSGDDYKRRTDDMYGSFRCEILAKCRNQYLKYLRSISEVYDYICVLDLDLLGGWSYDGISHAIFTMESDQSYGCVSSYGVLSEHTNSRNIDSEADEPNIMYDSLAFRPIGWKMGALHVLHTPVFNRVEAQRGNPPIEVQSNFGGMAIYKYKALIDKEYGSAELEDGHIDPDHVVINWQIFQAGWKIILDPSMIVSYSHHKYSRRTMNS